MKIYLLFIFNLFIHNNDSNLIHLANKKVSEYKPKNRNYAVIIDYRKPMLSERLFLIDLTKQKIILKSPVSQAIKTGKQFPTEFSNELGSEKSCYGAFITAETYFGKYGYSMVLDGMDKGINDNARKRKIVFHSTKRLSNPLYPLTYGCFATAEDVNNKIIHLTKNGCLVYVIK